MHHFFFIIILVQSLSFGVSVSGIVKNKASGKSIPNANVFLSETGRGTVTNPYGQFKLDLENGIYTLHITTIGFKPFKKEIILNESPLELNVEMESTILEFGEISVEGLFTTRLGYESVDVLDKKKIEDLNKNSAAEILGEIPGVDVQFAHGSGRNVNVSIRGSSDYKPGGYNNRVLILLDGFPLLIPNSGSPDWSSIPIQDVQRIEIDHNAASSQYGHNSMGGVLNLITDHTDTVSTQSLRFSSGSNQLFQGSISSKFNQYKWNVGLTGFARYSGGHRFNSDDELVRIRMVGKLQNNQGKTHRISFINSWSETGHPGFITSPTWRRSKRVSSYVHAHFFYPLLTGLSLSNSVFLNTYKTQYFDRNDTPLDQKEDNQNYDDVSTGLRTEMLLTRWSRWIVMSGIDVGWDKSEVSVYNSIYDSPTQTTLGSFTQSKYSIGGGWNIGTGLRYDYRTVNPGNGFKMKTFEHLSPKFNIMYEIKNERAFTLSYSEGFRAPSLSELYLLHQTSYGLTVQGNPKLKPEKVKTIEIRYEHPHSQQWKWSIAMFKNRYENMIDFVYSLPTLAINRKGVSGYGWEFQFNWKLSTAIHITGNYVFLHLNDLENNPILYRSKHRANMQFKFRFQPFLIRFTGKGWSSQKYDDFLSHDYQTIDDKIIFPVKELPKKILFNIGIEKEIGEYDLTLQIENMFDIYYELIQDYPMPGRVWKVKLNRPLN